LSVDNEIYGFITTPVSLLFDPIYLQLK